MNIKVESILHNLEGESYFIRLGDKFKYTHYEEYVWVNGGEYEVIELKEIKHTCDFDNVNESCVKIRGPRKVAKCKWVLFICTGYDIVEEDVEFWISAEFLINSYAFTHKPNEKGEHEFKKIESWAERHSKSEWDDLVRFKEKLKDGLARLTDEKWKEEHKINNKLLKEVIMRDLEDCVMSSHSQNKEEKKRVAKIDMEMFEKEQKEKIKLHKERL